MRTVVYAAAATEPLTIAEVMAHLRMDEGNQEPAPTAPTAALISPAAAGNVNNGAHRYLVTFVTATGETQAGASTAAVTVVNSAVNGKVSLTTIPIGSAVVTARKVYRTAAAGVAYLLLATIADNTTTIYTDNIADASLGVGAPAVNTTDDQELSGLISTARKEVEKELQRKLITQTLDAYFDEFPCGGFLLPPLQTISAVTYIDTAGVEQTLAADQYKVDAVSVPARLMPAYGVTWPSTRCEVNAVKVRFVAGYGTAAAVPTTIKQWMKLRISALWQNRSTNTVDGRQLITLPADFTSCLLDDEKVWGLS